MPGGIKLEEGAGVAGCWVGEQREEGSSVCCCDLTVVRVWSYGALWWPVTIWASHHAARPYWHTCPPYRPPHGPTTWLDVSHYPNPLPPSIRELSGNFFHLVLSFSGPRAVRSLCWCCAVFLSFYWSKLLKPKGMLYFFCCTFEVKYLALSLFYNDYF